MPYEIVRDGERYCVHKQNPDKTPGERVPGGCHDTRAEALAHMRALYAAEGREKGMFTVKQHAGRYYWVGMPTNNARDRDGEIISAEAIRKEAMRPGGELWYSHVPLRIGQTEWRGVINGHLVECGLFDDTPVARAVASHIAAHPETGWAMSVGFRGKANREGIYDTIVMKERSVLPQRRAANPYTQFNVGGGMDEQMKAALNEMLALVSGDPVALETVKAILQAAEQGKALDEAGVERKAAAETPAPDAEEPQADTPPVEESVAEPEATPKHKAEQLPLIAEDVSDGVLKGIKDYVDSALKDSLDAQAEAINANLKAVGDALTELLNRMDRLEAQEKALREAHETPRNILERLKGMSVKSAPETAIDKSDPLASKKPVAAADDNPLAIFGRR